MVVRSLRACRRGLRPHLPVPAFHALPAAFGSFKAGASGGSAGMIAGCEWIPGFENPDLGHRAPGGNVFHRAKSTFV
jgi:hypothetical protein